MDDFRNRFLRLALAVQALRFGDYTLKSGRRSPYFFNAGAFSSGAALAGLAMAYADTLAASGLAFDHVHGPAYKGIPLATALVCELARRGQDLPCSYNRKETKTHGEGGDLIGAPLAGRVLIVDDVISAGTAVRETLARIRAHGATPAAVLIALDRQERGSGARSAAQEVSAEHGIPVLAVARLDDLLELVRDDPALLAHRDALEAYRAEWGVA